MTLESAYLAQSTLVATGERDDLDLATALGMTPQGLVENPEFFSGFAARPQVLAAGLLTCADVAATRYFDMSALTASLDPVVTASGELLRFESFSADNGVYARFDLLSDGIDAGDVGYGTTNVDVNQPLRTALASVGREILMHLQVGNEELRVSTMEGTHTERKVDLPARWIRGFAEVPVIQSRMQRVFTVPGRTMATFLPTLPRSGAGRTMYVAPTPRGLQPATERSPNAIRLPGTARITSARRISRFAQEVSAFTDEFGSTAWVFELPGARLTLALTPDPYRGFSGEGGLLHDLAGGEPDQAHTDAETIHELLAWEPTIDPAKLATTAGLSADRVSAALAVLAASGRVGFDLSAGRYFQREIPYDAERVAKDNPRLKAARKLVEANAVQPEGGRFRVSSGDHSQWVTMGDEPSCTCPWWTEYQGGRGPCKHVLAVAITQKAEARVEV